MTIGKRIKEQRLQQGISVDDLALKLKKNRATIYRYESDDIENLPITIIEPLARALNTTPAYLMGWNEKNKPDTIPATDNILPLPEVKKVPLLGEIACGLPILAEENIQDYLACPVGIHADFCLKCKGNSMIGDRIYDGDIVYIKQQPDVENGQIAAVFIDGEATLKRVYKTPNFLMLKAANPMYQDIILEPSQQKDIRILGEAVAFFSCLKRKE